MPKRRRDRKAKTTRYIFIVAVLLVTAGVAGYSASSFFGKPDKVANNDTGTNQQPVENKPDSMACIAALPAKMKFAQKTMFAVYSDQVDEITPILAELGIGGVIIMDEVSKEQIAKLSEAFAVPPTIAVDQEGGIVQRYKSQGVLPGASDMANLSKEQAYELYLKDSQYLTNLGITTNFAPVLDVESRSPSPLPGRMYSGSPDVVADYALEAARAMGKVGIQPVFKHFPGMGSATGNTDFVTATTDQFETLEPRDLLPYKQLADAEADVMVGNMIVPGLTNGRPAIWSPEAMTLLRSLGYKNSVVYSDSLTALAVPGSLENAAVTAWRAGVDVTVIVQKREQAVGLPTYMNAIISLGTSQLDTGSVEESALNESVARILARKGIDPCSINQAS